MGTYRAVITFPDEFKDIFAKSAISSAELVRTAIISYLDLDPLTCKPRIRGGRRDDSSAARPAEPATTKIEVRSRVENAKNQWILARLLEFWGTSNAAPFLNAIIPKVEVGAPKLADELRTARDVALELEKEASNA